MIALAQGTNRIYCNAHGWKHGWRGGFHRRRYFKSSSDFNTPWHHSDNIQTERSDAVLAGTKILATTTTTTTTTIMMTIMMMMVTVMMT
jgi:hypothetical protein